MGLFDAVSLDRLIISDIEAHQFRLRSCRHVYVDPEGHKVVYYVNLDGHMLIDDIILTSSPLYV